MYLFKTGNNWVCGPGPNDFVPSGTMMLSVRDTVTVIITPVVKNDLISFGPLDVTTIYLSAAGTTKYATLDAFIAATQDFFVDAAQVAADSLDVRVTALENKALDVLYLDYWVEVDLLPDPTDLDPGEYAISYAIGAASRLEVSRVWVVAPARLGGGSYWTEVVGYLSDENAKNRIFINRSTTVQYSWTGSVMVPLTTVLQFATQSDAETGTEDSKIMTALKVRQATDYYTPLMVEVQLALINSFKN